MLCTVRLLHAAMNVMAKLLNTTQIVQEPMHLQGLQLLYLAHALEWSSSTMPPFNPHNARCLHAMHGQEGEELQ